MSDRYDPKQWERIEKWRRRSRRKVAMQHPNQRALLPYLLPYFDYKEQLKETTTE